MITVLHNLPSLIDVEYHLSLSLLYKIKKASQYLNCRRRHYTRVILAKDYILMWSKSIGQALELTRSCQIG